MSTVAKRYIIKATRHSICIILLVKELCLIFSIFSTERKGRIEKEKENKKPTKKLKSAILLAVSTKTIKLTSRLSEWKHIRSRNGLKTLIL